MAHEWTHRVDRSRRLASRVSVSTNGLGRGRSYSRRTSANPSDSQRETSAPGFARPSCRWMFPSGNRSSRRTSRMVFTIGSGRVQTAAGLGTVAAMDGRTPVAILPHSAGPDHFACAGRGCDHRPRVWQYRHGLAGSLRHRFAKPPVRSFRVDRRSRGRNVSPHSRSSG